MSTVDEHRVLADALALMRSAVATVAAADPDPADPYRGLYVGDDVAVALGAAAPTPGPTSASSAPASGSRSTAYSARCSASASRPRSTRDAARLFGYLHDDLPVRTRARASSPACWRAIRVADADVLVCFDARAACASGAVRLGATARWPTGP